MESVSIVIFDSKVKIFYRSTNFLLVFYLTHFTTYQNTESEEWLFIRRGSVFLTKHNLWCLLNLTYNFFIREFIMFPQFNYMHFEGRSYLLVSWKQVVWQFECEPRQKWRKLVAHYSYRVLSHLKAKWINQVYLILIFMTP